MKKRLFRQIKENLEHKAIVNNINNYLLDRFFSYKSDNLQEELTQALNLLTKKEVKIEHLDGYRLMHESFSSHFENTFGFRNVLYSLYLPKKKAKKIWDKLDLEDWSAANYFNKNFFTSFFHHSLYFDRFGLALQNTTSFQTFEHEGIHALQPLCLRFKDALDLNPNRYDRQLIMTYVETELMDEILCFMMSLEPKDNINDYLKTNYIPSYRKAVYKCSTYSKNEKRGIRRWIKSIEKNVDEIVEASFSIQENFSEELLYPSLIPLFFSMRPTSAEIQSKRYFSPFIDVRCLVWLKLWKAIR